MQLSINDFFHEFRQDVLVGAETAAKFSLEEFISAFANELIESGSIEGCQCVHYRHRDRKAMRVDGYWFSEFNDDDVLTVFIADFESRESLEVLGKGEVTTLFSRLHHFLETSITTPMYDALCETTPEYSMTREIYERAKKLRKIEFHLLSERRISDRFGHFPDSFVCELPVTHQVWDISRLHRLSSSKGQREPVEIDLLELCGTSIPCLPAHVGENAFESYLIVMPGKALHDIYDKYDAQLLEQNVRCFLQARGKVNKGIKSTIISEPEKFFAYNNGITATAKNVKTINTERGLEITDISDLQIVNGGQTTASIFSTCRKDKADLSKVFVQMKLSIISKELSEEFVPKISEYANTQNRVNAADFFANHPFHLRIQDFSRRLYAPAKQGEQKETKWFYERARGQYADAMTKLTAGEQKKFKIINPKSQMITKTDLAKYENVWDEHPKWVNLGAQKNFGHFATRIAQEWKKSPNTYNEYYFKRMVARAIIFRTTEKLVSNQKWYGGGYRANIVAYSLALLGEFCKKKDKEVDFNKVWLKQQIYHSLQEAIQITAEIVNRVLLSPPQGISNISEWAKKDSCWEKIKEVVTYLDHDLPTSFIDELVSNGDVLNSAQEAKKVQRIDNGIEAQIKVINLGASYWKRVAQKGVEQAILSEKDLGLLKVVGLLPNKAPTENQSKLLLALADRIM